MTVQAVASVFSVRACPRRQCARGAPGSRSRSFDAGRPVFISGPPVLISAVCCSGKHAQGRTK